MYQLVVVWEAVFGFSDFFLRLNMFVHFMMCDLRAHLSIPHWVFSNFWPKTAWPSCTTLPIHPTLAQSNFFVCLFPQMKKFLKGKHFADVEDVKQQVAEGLKGIKIDKFKNCFEQWKKCLHRCIASNGEYFEGDWSLNIWEYTIFNKFWGFWGSPSSSQKYWDRKVHKKLIHSFVCNKNSLSLLCTWQCTMSLEIEIVRR